MTSSDRLATSTTSLVFECYVRTEHFGDFARSILDLWTERGFPAIQSALVGPLNLEQPISPTDIVPHLARGPGDCTRDNRYAEFTAGDHINGGIMLHGDAP